MDSTRLHMGLGLAFLLAAATGCGNTSTTPRAEAGTAGAAGTTSSGGGGGAAGSAGAGPTCPGVSPVGLASTGRVDLPIRATVNGAAVVVGEAAAGRTGREYRLSLFKFFLSEPSLVTADGHETPAQFVTAEGAPMPYELHLVDADDSATQLAHLVAEPGSYTALRFGVGVPAGCNNMPSTGQAYPLNPDSDMFWTWGAQFLFIRIEGNTRPDATAEWMPFAYHVGFDQAFSNLVVPGSIVVGPSGTGPTLSLDIDLMLTSDTATLPPTKHSVPDGWVVDNLENNHAFTLQ